MADRISDFWDRVKALSKEKKITQDKLCEDLNFNAGSYKNRIARNVAPDVFDAEQIAKYLNVSVEYLVSGIDNNIYKNKLSEIAESIKEVL